MGMWVKNEYNGWGIGIGGNRDSDGDGNEEGGLGMRMG